MPSQNKPQEGISNSVFYMFVGIMVVTGSINTIADKIQQNIELHIEGQILYYKSHQKFITFCMFLGESLCMLFYLIQLKCQSKKPTTEDVQSLTEEKEQNLVPTTNEQQNKPTQKEEYPNMNTHFYYFYLPALIDLCNGTLGSISLTFLASSVFQMFKGVIIIFTAIFSVIFLKKKI